MNEEGAREIDLLKLIVEEKRIETDRKFKEAELKLKEQEHRLDRLQIWIPVITIVISVTSTIVISLLTSRTTLEAAQINANTQIQLDLNKYSNEQQNESAQRKVPQRKLDAELKDRIENVFRVLQDTETKMGKGDRDDPRFIYIRVFDLLNGKDYVNNGKPIAALYAENQNKNFKQLVTELTDVVDDANKSELIDALSGYDRLRNLSESGSENKQNEEQAIKTVNELLKKEFSRWR